MNNFFRNVLKAKYKFKLPSKKHNVVLDLNNSYYFVNLFKRDKTFFLDTRFYDDVEFTGVKNFQNELYLLVFIYSILNYFTNKKYTLMQHYIINCIKFIDPKNIITFTDNNLFFLRLKNIFEHKKLVIFQYTWRTRLTFDDMYSHIKNEKSFKRFKVDYTCIWGKNSKFFYSQFVDTKFLITGSIKNNFFPVKKNLRKDSIIFISQFRMHFDYNKKLNIFKKNYFKDNALNNILKYCIKNNLKLKILGCAKENSKYEKNYFNNLLGENNFIFLKRTIGLSSYKYSLNYKYFITFCSSLAYELIGRGKRVAFLPWTEQFQIKYKNIKFNESFYSNKKKTGLIWSNTPSKKEVFRLLNYVTKAKDKSWKNIQKILIDPIITYDKDNKMTKNLFKKLRIN